MKTAVFAGTFDPITKGHQYVINKCLEDFDKVIVVVADNVEKTPVFSSEERKDLIYKVFSDTDKVEVVIYHGLMMDFMKSRDLIYYVRGIRTDKDLAYENKMKAFNESIYPSLKTIYYYATDDVKDISSSAVRKDVQKAVDGDALPISVKEKVISTLLKKD